MVIGWMFASYLVGGYSTYLPKYIETQYGRSASVADMWAGLISIGSVAVSTALGGWILARFNLRPRTALLALLASWSIIFITFLLGITVGCNPPALTKCFIPSSPRSSPDSDHMERAGNATPAANAISCASLSRFISSPVTICRPVRPAVDILMLGRIR